MRSVRRDRPSFSSSETISLDQAMKENKLVLEGDAGLRQNIAKWLNLSVFATQRKLVNA